MTLGDPDIQPDSRIKEAACLSIQEGKTRYSANAGLIELRRVISKSIEKRNHIKYDPNCEIAVTIGAMEAIYVSLLCLVNSGDEVIIPEPYWINYRQMVAMCGAKAVIVDKFENKEKFQISADAIEEAVTNKTKVIIINSPNNPSGVVYDKYTMKRIADIAKKYNLTVITDEVYRSLIYDGTEYTSILDFDGMKERTVLVYSFSKEFAMTGWRLGYAAAPETLISAITRLQENIVACAPLASQHAVIPALEDDNFNSDEIVNEFAKRRAVVINEVQNIPKLTMNPPDGTFYAFINIAQTGMDAETFAYKLLEKKHVAVVPGSAYGECAKNYIRIAFTLDVDRLKEGFERIRDFVLSL